jgi:hypothetical protein
MLHEFIAVNRDEIIRRCRAKVATRSVPPPTEVELGHGVPVFLDTGGRLPSRPDIQPGDYEQRGPAWA